MDFSFLSNYSSYFVSGTLVTLFISVVTILAGTLLGILFCLMKLSKTPLLRWIANIYIEIFRGTPMLVQVLIGFLVLQDKVPVPDIVIANVELSRLVAGLIVISLNSGAYVAEIFRSGINAINFGQTEAAYSLGLRKSQTFLYVILPQAFRNILPALGNEFITIIKDSSLLSSIGIYELLFNAQTVQSMSFRGLEPLLVAAAIYFVLTFTLSRLLAIVEKQVGKGYRKRV